MRVACFEAQREIVSALDRHGLSASESVYVLLQLAARFNAEYARPPRGSRAPDDVDPLHDAPRLPAPISDAK